MFHSQKRQYVSRETLGGYSETVYRYMEGAGEFYGGKRIGKRIRSSDSKR